MKKIFILGSVLVTLLFATSCEIKYGENPLPATSFGYYVYSKTSHNVLSYYISVIRAVNVAEEWIKAPDDQTKYAIEDSYFPNNKIRLIDNVCSISGIISIKMDSESFSKVGSKWEITDYNYESVFEIETVGENSWIIKDSNTKINNLISSADITISLDETGSSYDDDYLIEGKGEFHAIGNSDKNFYKIAYIIGKELQVNIPIDNVQYHYYNTLYSVGVFHGGSMDISIERSIDNGGGDEVHADLSLGTKNGERVKISYLGLEEIW